MEKKDCVGLPENFTNMDVTEEASERFGVSGKIPSTLKRH